MPLSRELASKLETLPSKPGVYVFRAKDDRVLYVGKATRLRERVRSYFQDGSRDGRFFIPLLAGALCDIETIVTTTEKEATLLEAQLIKTHKPRYNVRLRDDKDYLSLRLDTRQTFPRIEVVRRPRADGARYFGPYTSASAARQTLRLVNRHFQLRTCADAEMRSRTRPCLQHQIGRCPAPCVLEVPRDEYARQVEAVCLFLDGRHDELARALTDRMHAASGRLDYERAATFRDQLRAIDSVQEPQDVARVTKIDQDVINFHREGDRMEVALLIVRAGKLTGVRTFGLSDVRVPDAEAIGAFVAEYYEQGTYLPTEVLLPLGIEAREGLSEVLGEKAARRVAVLVPHRGTRARLIVMARENAEHSFHEKARARDDIERRLDEIREKLRLPAIPRRIECLDISHLGGADAVGAIVVLRDGIPYRRGYRSFHVRTAQAGDDYGAVHEVLARRLRRMRASGPGSAWEPPDLLVIDGGKGQLATALAVLRDLGITSIPVAAIAKDKKQGSDARAFDRVFIPGQKNPIVLRDSAPGLQLLAFARDEAHRFSNAFRVEASRRRQLTSELDGIPGVGPKTRVLLLRAFGSASAVFAANADDLVAQGATRAQARAIAAHAQARSRSAGMDAITTEDAEAAAVEHAFDATAPE